LFSRTILLLSALARSVLKLTFLPGFADYGDVRFKEKRENGVNLMPKRKLRVVNSDNQLFCVCEACSASFKSSSPDYEQAEREVKGQFDAHECKAGGTQSE
jgi:hypothetical protein